MESLILIFKAAIMGVVEGITEFLPISSTGHLIIVGHFIKFETTDGFSEMFEVVIQLGAILAIVVLYWDKIWNSLKNIINNDKDSGFSMDNWGFKLWSNMIVAFIPSAVAGILLKKQIDKLLFNNITAVAAAMVVGGFLLIFIENKYRKKSTTRDINYVGYGQAFLIGCFQCLSLWPGMSRSASTIMGGWVAGLGSTAAAEFSFFLAIPTMFAASFYSLIKMDVALSVSEIIALAVGFLVSFIVALPVVEKFVNFLKKKPMRVFSIYRILVGGIFLILIFTKVIA